MIAANAAANGVTVDASVADLSKDPLPWAPTITANVTGPLHGRIAPRLERAPRRLIAAGMLARYADDVTAAYAHTGLREVARRHRGGVVGGDARVIRLAVRVDRAHAETVLHELMELSPGGLEERDVDADTVEYALYGAPGELPELPDLRAAAGGALVEVVDHRGARTSTGASTTRRSTSGRSACAPPWVEPRPGAIDVVIDPGQAFGTGQHHTTRLCLELLLEVGDRGGLADWGCGSGVLAVTAALLGFAPVTRVRRRARVGGGRARRRPRRTAWRSRRAVRPAPRARAVRADRHRQPRPAAAAGGRGEPARDRRSG